MVGPNGSGKSNVIDAMLFVFGKRAKQVGQFDMKFIMAVEYFSLRVLDKIPGTERKWWNGKAQ